MKMINDWGESVEAETEKFYTRKFKQIETWSSNYTLDRKREKRMMKTPTTSLWRQSDFNFLIIVQRSIIKIISCLINIYYISFEIILRRGLFFKFLWRSENTNGGGEKTEKKGPKRHNDDESGNNHQNPIMRWNIKVNKSECYK